MSLSINIERPIKIIECPRDAMQGWKTFIPTQKKIEYINSLLEVGFDTIDFGSFVSPKAIPQMSDTKEVITKLKVQNSNSKLLAIIANVRGAQEAGEYDEITYLGFPFSISETFQQRNTNASIENALARVTNIQNICIHKNKEPVIYISMAFGNPYGDPYSEELLFQWAHKLVSQGIKIISLADTVGVATPIQIQQATSYLISALPNTEVGVHLHATAVNGIEKIAGAYRGGCLRFDGALKGIGGCPMANNDLVGNLNTEWLFPFFDEKNRPLPINKEALQKSLALAEEIFI